MKLVLCVSTDEYELPLAVAGTQREMAKMWGVTQSAVSKSVHGVSCKSSRAKHRFIEVEVEDE